MSAKGRICSVTLDDAELTIEVSWGAVNETIRVDAESLQADHVRRAAAEVVEGHLDHLGQDGYIIGDPPPGSEGEGQV